MKITKSYLLLAACAISLTVGSSQAATVSDATPTACTNPSMCSLPLTTIADTNTNGVPDLLKTCPVSGDKLNGDMGAPYVFSYKAQEVKLCCKSCKKDFDKNPAKYMKLIRAADKK